MRSKPKESLDTSSFASQSELSFRKEEKINDILLNIQNFAKETNIFDIVFEASRMRGDNYIKEKEFNKALGVYKFLKTYCKVADNIEAEMLMSEQLGHMYGLIKYHSQAADMFRMMLKLAWVLQDANMELKAYSHLSNEHFHMANLEKSKYYLVRYSRGLLESDQSRMKNSIIQSYKDRIGAQKKK